MRTAIIVTITVLWNWPDQESPVLRTLESQLWEPAKAQD
jgi:hypothetical protein